VIYDLAGSKEQLFRDVMAAINDDLATCLAAAVTAIEGSAEKLHAGILAFLRFVKERRAAWAALMSADAGPASSAVAAMRRRQAELVASLVVGGIDSDHEAPDPRTAEALANAINGAVEFVAMWWQQHPDIAPEALADLLSSAFSPGLFELSRRTLTS
jgi:AcrR family transcriptional regulator